MQQTISACPSPDTRTFGCYEITAQTTVDGGYSINVFTATGGNRENALCFTTRDRMAYRLVYAVIREGGINNVHPDGVQAAIRDALTRDLDDMQRRREPSCQARIPELERLVGEVTPADEKAEMDALAADINRTLDRSPVRTLADTVPAGTKPQVPPTKTRRKLSPAGQRALNANINGIVYPGPGISRATLNSLAGQGFGRLHFEGTRKKIACLELNKQGMAAAVRTVA